MFRPICLLGLADVDCCGLSLVEFAGWTEFILLELNRSCARECGGLLLYIRACWAPDRGVLILSGWASRQLGFVKVGFGMFGIFGMQVGVDVGTKLMLMN
jgi:hypothetical protein